MENLPHIDIQGIHGILSCCMDHGFAVSSLGIYAGNRSPAELGSLGSFYKSMIQQLNIV